MRYVNQGCPGQRSVLLRTSNFFSLLTLLTRRVYGNASPWQVPSAVVFQGIQDRWAAFFFPSLLSNYFLPDLHSPSMGMPTGVTSRAV